jgi:hypothetical protein
VNRCQGRRFPSFQVDAVKGNIYDVCPVLMHTRAEYSDDADR